MKFSSQIKPISYLKANASEIIRNLGDQQEPMVITKMEKPRPYYKMLRATNRPKKR